MKRLVFTMGIFFMASAATFGQSYTDTVWDLIQNAYYENYNEGYEMKNYIIGAIDEDEENSWTFQLKKNKDYIFEAFCDEDCSDLDLYLYDKDGVNLDSDTLEDKIPIIYFSPEKNGKYEIKVSMYSCSVEPCYWGIALFEK